MDETPLLSYVGMKQKAVPGIYYASILGIPFTIGILYALLVTDNNCEGLRTWLYVEGVLQVIFTGASISQISNKFISKSGCLIKMPLFFLAFFQICWLVLGTIYAFSGDNCFDLYAEGFVMVLAITVVEYATITVFLILYFITFIVETRRKKA